MSTEDLTGFVARLETDELLRERAAGLQDLGGRARLDGLCRLAAEYGFEVTPAECELAAAGAAAAALDDETLDRVAAAGPCDSPSVLAAAPAPGQVISGF